MERFEGIQERNLGGDIDIDFIAFCFSHCNAWVFLLVQ
jgi:hypothetical protein